MFVNKNSKRHRMVLVFLFFIPVSWSILKNNLSHAGSIQVDIRINRLADVNIAADNAIAQATAELHDCPAPVKRGEVRGEIRNCAQEKNSSATVNIGNKTIVHGKNDAKR